MSYRLSGSIDGNDLDFILREGEHLLGASHDCDYVIDHPTVSRRHAVISVSGDGIEIEDRDSRNGTWVDGRRIRRETVSAGAVLNFGKVRLVLDRVSDLDAVLGLEIDDLGGPAVSTDDATARSTVGFRSLVTMPLELMPDLLFRLEDGQSETEIAQAAAALLFGGLPATEVTVRAADTDGVVFEARRAPSLPSDSRRTLTVRGATLELIVEIAGTRLAETLEPLFAGIGSALRIAGARGRTSNAVPSSSSPPRRPDPPTVVPLVNRIYDQAARIARGEVGVLIEGESGTGKEVLARFIHEASPRKEGAFVTLNCAALPRDLLESELFGIDRGVATGVDARPGKFEAADGGILFLDEIGDMNIETQAKILRVLQEGVVFRLGSTVPRPARCRIIAATNRTLATMMAEGSFREDLYYRIAVWTVEMPPLRHRSADIPALAAHFLQRAAHRQGVRVRGISLAALEAMKRYHWPGNIRQLENEMQRVVLFLDDNGILDSNRLNPEIVSPRSRQTGGALEERLERLEKAEILAEFQRCEGNASEVARVLGIGRSTLYRRMKALGIDPP